ncbi:hypothetical protein Zmor_010906 [Zophobas morio]|uniref:PHD-type domain-containing protein n=1 Tax=Zophobas morio TaxID=2755281 RepID=A0AA38ILV6_9CUCU|nr:hypothetical protein Zmor_010906 [Zophobas morio]
MGAKCKKCGKGVLRCDDYVSCSTCKYIYHAGCAGLTREIYEKMKVELTLSAWCCSFCNSKPESKSTLSATSDVNINVDKNPSLSFTSDSLKSLFNDVLKIALEPLTAELNALKLEMGNLRTENSLLHSEVNKLTLALNRVPNPDTLSAAGNTLTTYSEVFKKNSQDTVIVKPKDKNQSVNKTKSDILSKVNPVNSAIDIGKVKNLKDGSVLLGCKDASKFKELASVKLSTSYDIKEVKTLRPRIRISGISNDIDESSVLSYAVKQNDFLFDKPGDYKLLKFLPLKKKADLFQALIEVDSLTYNKAINIGHCLIGLNSCSIYCGLEIPRCFQCCGFNHSSSSCRSIIVCPRCSENHNVKECKAASLCCVNCRNLKSNSKHANIKTDHASWDHDNCRAYELAITKLKQDLFGIAE